MNAASQFVGFIFFLVAGINSCIFLPFSLLTFGVGLLSLILSVMFLSSVLDIWDEYFEDLIEND